jgi:hypothetical protein
MHNAEHDDFSGDHLVEDEVRIAQQGNSANAWPPGNFLKAFRKSADTFVNPANSLLKSTRGGGIFRYQIGKDRI